MTSFKIQAKVQTFLDIYNACKVLTEEATIEVTDKALTFRGFSPDHVAMVDIAYPAKVFEIFHGSAKLGVRTEEIVKILKRFDDKDTLLTLTEEDSNLVITDGSKTFYNRLVDTTPSDTPLPKFKFEASVELTKEVLSKAISDVQTVAQFVTFEVKDHNSFEVSGKGDIGSASIFPEYEYCEGEAKSIFGLDYLTAVLKAVTGIEKVKLEFTSKQPLRLSLGYIKYYLAPRVSD